MQIIITTEEISPGEMRTRVYGKGQATELESRMVHHLCSAIQQALESFDADQSHSTPMLVIDRDINPQ